MSAKIGSHMLRVFLIGDREKLGRLEGMLNAMSELEISARAPSAEYSFSLIRRSSAVSSDVEAVFIDPFADEYDPWQSSKFILNTRATRPDIVFVLLVGRDELMRRRHEFDTELRLRVGHYYSLDPSMEVDAMGPALAQVVRACMGWRANLPPVAARRDFEYDVAISFAGEDREFAQSLARALRERDVKVFLDDDYRAVLWGKDLYTTLYDIYYRKARYCILLVSKAYRDKMWTGHERQAAQARALEMRGTEYILPIRMEDVTIQGLPPTTAYLSGNLGVEEIINLFIAKMASGS